MKITFRLFVKPSRNCIATLAYLLGKIETVNSMGVAIKIVKLGGSTGEEYTKKICKSAKITLLPTMLLPDGVKIVGREKIIGLIESNLAKRSPKEQVDSMGSNEDMASFWQRELFDGQKNPRTDGEDEEDDLGDIQKRVADQMRGTKHRSGGANLGQPHDDDRDADRPREDNIELKHAIAPGNRPKGSKLTEDSMDSMMLQAFLANTDTQPDVLG